MLVGVVGAGYVGLVTAVGLAAAGHDVIVAEADATRLRALEKGRVPFFEPGLQEWLQEIRRDRERRLTFVRAVEQLDHREVIVVAVGTPPGPLGQADLTQVRSAVRSIADTAARGTIVAMKSSVPPGTGRELLEQYLEGKGLRYVSNPEFLREGKAVQDWLHPYRVIIGADHREEADCVAALYRHLGAPMLITDITSGEMVKYASNALLATKISFINEIANICELVGANIDDVARGVGMDPRLGSDFLRAGVGYGGSCFPKDTQGLNFTAAVNGYSFELLRAVIEVNRRQRIRVVHRLSEILGGLAGRRVAVLGLAFKPGTDDARGSPGLEIALMLRGLGADVRTYDPVARLQAEDVRTECVCLDGPPCSIDREIVRVHSLVDAVDGSEAVVVATEWDEFLTADWSLIKSHMRPPYLVYDGRNCLDVQVLTGLGFRYVGVGRLVREGCDSGRP